MASARRGRRCALLFGTATVSSPEQASLQSLATPLRHPLRGPAKLPTHQSWSRGTAASVFSVTKCLPRIVPPACSYPVHMKLAQHAAACLHLVVKRHTGTGARMRPERFRAPVVASRVSHTKFYGAGNDWKRIKRRSPQAHEYADGGSHGCRLSSWHHRRIHSHDDCRHVVGGSQRPPRWPQRWTRSWPWPWSWPQGQGSRLLDHSLGSRPLLGRFR